MNLYFNRSRNLFIPQPATNTPLISVSCKLRDSEPLLVRFVKDDGTPDPFVEGDSNLVMKFAVKASYSTQVFLALESVFTPISDNPGAYAGKLSLNTDEMIEAVGTQETLRAVSELTWSLDGGNSWKSSPTLPFIVNADIIVGGEGGASNISGGPVPINHQFAIPARGYLDFTDVSLVADGHTVTAGSRTYTWKNTPSAAGHIGIPGVLNASLFRSRVNAAIRGIEASEGFPVFNTVNPDVESFPSGDLLSVNAREPGPEGNALPFTVTGTGIVAVDGEGNPITTLGGGADEVFATPGRLYSVIVTFSGIYVCVATQPFVYWKKADLNDY